MKFILEHWALILLFALTILLVMLIIDTSWPVAYVYVVSTPAGATVSDCDNFIWTTPARIPVQHEGLIITVSYPERVPVDTVLLPDMSDEPVLISLPYRFPVEISSEPSAASVLLDGFFIGHTPLNVSIDDPGIHHLSLTLQNLIVLEDSVMLLANSPDTLRYVLPRLHPSGMILVPSEAGRSGDILQPYLIARYEVTNGEFCEYIRILEPAPTRDTTNRWGRTDTLEDMFPGDYPLLFYINSSGEWAIQDGLENLPVAGLTCSAAEEYCAWITTLDTSGIVYRLPTEKEWYTAALAGGSGPWPWGSRRPDGNLLNLSDSTEGMLRRHPSIDDGFSYSAPVGSYPYNNWGLYDMAGNVWEYCRSFRTDSSVVAMGGSWLSSMNDCRCDARMHPDTGLGYPYIGFRTAASIGSPE
ncbi:MAG: SUMF1/EgtB/PvdO family nonheme iron enzyme [Candidatus Aegiribacteria sp.]|nr:SUMF1/EgtB/PvdO family nonheme iron enzyme [Candidatus Aegiribacteria sp.]